MYNSSMKVARIILTLPLILSFAIIPLHADALVPPLLPFGGWPVITPVPCTCSATVWTWFAPLYITGSIPLTGPMTYVPYATVPLANFLITIPATPHQGAYIPGVPACWVGVVPFCFPLPNIGVMGFVGTGLPGGK